ECRAGERAESDSRAVRTWRIRCAVAPWRDRQWEDRSVFARGAGNAGARENGARSGAGDRADVVDRAAVPVLAWRELRGCRGAAFGAERRGTGARMVARAQWRGASRGRDAVRSVCAAGKY